MITPHAWVAWSLHLARATDPLAPLEPQLDAALNLTPCQLAAAQRLLAMAQRAGGALLADAPGLGKSRVGLATALSLALQRRGPLLICAPPRLIPQWRRLIATLPDVAVPIALWSHTAMSRATPPPVTPAAILVDEAHHLRHPHTKRAQALRAAIGGAAVLLLSATPFCRDVSDVVSLLRFFVHDAWAQEAVGLRIDDAVAAHQQGRFELSELLALVALRRDGDDALLKPSLRLREIPYEPSAAELSLWASLEASLHTLSWALLGQRWPRALFIELARHRWESGPHALASTLSDLADLHARALQAHRLGYTLDLDAFKTLFAKHPDQEPLPWCWQNVSCSSPLARPDDVQRDLDALQRLLTLVDLASLDGGRERALIQLLRGSAHRWLILSQYETTASALFELLARSLGPSTSIGLMTGSSSRATGLGTIAPEDLLARFSPRARQLATLPAHQSIQILVATDCMAEGVDLQDCAHLVLVDLPYSPLVIEQRVGRLVRPHSAHREVEIYSLRPLRWRESLGTIPRLTQRLLDADRIGLPMHAASATLHLDHPPKTVGPLDAILLRDTLAARLSSPDNPTSLAWRFWRAADGDASRLWIFARLTSQHHTSARWGLVDTHGVELRLELLLPHLSTLSERHDPLIPWRPGGPLWEAALAALEEQRATLHAAQLAPHRLLPGCVQRRAWSLLSSSPLAQNARVQSCYARLMRPLPPHLVERLEAALCLDPPALLCVVEALPEPIIPTIELLGGILL